MDITQLRTLACVAELGSLSKAADRLCTAQPALSRHVRMLEEELGARLFTRHGRGMVITEEGRVVLRHAQRILAEVDGIKADVMDRSGSLSGHVSIGMPPTVAEILAVPLVAALRSSVPNAICRIVSAYSLYLFDWVQRDDLDIALLYDPRAIRSLKSEPLLEESLYLIAPGDAGFRLERAVDWRELTDRPLLLPSPAHSLRQIVERSADASGARLDVRLEADSYTVLKQLVLNGHGWTVLPLAPLQAEIADGRLCAAPLAGPAITRTLELAVSADRPTTRLAATVHQTIVSTTATLVSSGAWSGKLRRR